MADKNEKNDKSDKSNKLKARLPRGLADRGPAEIAATRRMIEAIRAVYERYGFEPLETPEFEYTDALGKFLPDQDRPNEGVFSFQDDDEQWLSLRYDLTAPLARYVAENFDALPKPYRSYRFGWVFRNEKPGPGRFWQFMQFDADTVGAPSMAADAEMCMMAADTMEVLGVPRGSYVVKVNNRKVLDGVMESIGLSGEANAGRRLTVLRALDKYDRLGRDNVGLLLGPGRKDESGDFTPGAGLDAGAIKILLQLLSLRLHVDFQAGRNGAVYNPKINVGASVEELVPRTLTSTISSNLRTYAETEKKRDIRELVFLEDGLRELEVMGEQFAAAGFDDGRIIIDPSVVRGLEYYTGPVYEVELTFETKDEHGKPVRFGSVGGGGRYDGLVGRFRNEAVPATGFSIGVSRLMAALTHLGKVEAKAEPGPVVVTVFDQDRIADYQKMVAALRNAEYAPGKKIRAELYLGAGKFGAQMKYADKRGSPCAVIQGGNEKEKGEVQIKDLILGATLTSIKDRDEYLKKQAQAQFACREDELVDKVREVLARHKVSWG
jgi:histidyl-tRNA synthetase